MVAARKGHSCSAAQLPALVPPPSSPGAPPLPSSSPPLSALVPVPPPLPLLPPESHALAALVSPRGFCDWQRIVALCPLTITATLTSIPWVRSMLTLPRAP